MMMLVMIKGSVSDETLPVNASIPVLKKKSPSKEQRKGPPELIQNYLNTHHLVESVQ